MREGGRRRAVAGALVAVVSGVLWAAPAEAQRVVKYPHLDPVGNVRAVTDASGNVIERHDYLPFGEEWCPGPPPGVCGAVTPGQPRRFTGKERDAETGLDYFGARYYRANVGRFTTTDPVYTWQENLVDPQRWNRYAYARSNPLRYTDPDGRSPTIVTGAWGAAIGGGIGFFGSVGAQLIKTGSVNWHDVGAATAGGAFAGFTAGFTLGLAPALGATGVIGVGATSNVAGGLVTRQLDSDSTEPVDPRAMAIDAASGAIGAGAGRIAGKPLADAARSATMRASAEAAAGETQMARDLAKLSAQQGTRAATTETVVGARVTNAIVPAGQAAAERAQDKRE